jgi:uncharacterized protein
MAGRIRFPAADIPVEGMAMDVELSDEWLEILLRHDDASVATGGTVSGTVSGSANGAGRLSGRLSRSGSDIVVRGRLITAVQVACVRCLEPAAIRVSADLSLLLQLRKSSQSRKPSRRQPSRRLPGDVEIEHEFTAAEADLDTYDGETVELDRFVRELILLEIPSFPLCRMSCPGIPQSATQQAPETEVVDPRLAPLGAFLEKGEGPITIDDLVAAAAERSAALRGETGRKPVLKANRGGRPRKKRNKS